MAKFNIEVQLDWFEEEENIDEILKSEVLRTLTKKSDEIITKLVSDKINEESDKYFSKVETIIGEKLNNFVEDFLNKKRTITDKWGDVKKSDVSVVDILKEKCDSFLDEKVSDSGRIVTGYEKGIPRIEYMLKRIVDCDMNRKIDKAIDEIKKKLIEYVNETIKSKIGENIAKVIGLENITEKVINNK